MLWKIKERSGNIKFTERSYLVLNEQLDCSYVFSFQALFTLDNVEADLLALIQGLKAAGLNRAKVHENVRAALLLDEAEAFTFVEPLYFTF